MQQQDLSFVKGSVRYLKNCFRREEPPTVEEMARVLDMTTSQLRRAAMSAVGCSPKKWIVRWQIREALRLMMEPGTSTTVIAYKCGFRSRSSLFGLFKRETGVGPREFQRRNSRVRTK